MPTLRNKRREAFCQHQATGKAKGAESIRAAGYICKTNEYAANKASKFLKIPAIDARIQELRAKVEKDLHIEHVNVIESLNQIAAASMADFADFEKNKVTYKSLKDIPKSLRAVIQEIHIKKTKYGDDIKIKLYSRMDALTLLGKNQQLFKEQLVLENPDGSNMVPSKIEVHFVKAKKSK